MLVIFTPRISNVEIILVTDDGARKLVQDFNDVTQETMVFQKRGGVRNCTCDVTTDNKTLERIIKA